MGVGRILTLGWQRGRKEGLGCRQDHLDLSPPWAFPARRCFKQTLLGCREGRAAPTTHGGHGVDNAKMMKDLAFRRGFIYKLRSTKNMLSQRLFANNTTDTTEWPFVEGQCYFQPSQSSYKVTIVDSALHMGN